MQDPDLSNQQAMMDYKRLGYSDNWITNAQTLEDNMKCDADGGDDNILK